MRQLAGQTTHGSQLASSGVGLSLFWPEMQLRDHGHWESPVLPAPGVNPVGMPMVDSDTATKMLMALRITTLILYYS